MISTAKVASETEGMEWMGPFHPAFDSVGDGIRFIVLSVDAEGSALPGEGLWWSET